MSMGVLDCCLLVMADKYGNMTLLSFLCLVGDWVWGWFLRSMVVASCCGSNGVGCCIGVLFLWLVGWCWWEDFVKTRECGLVLFCAWLSMCELCFGHCGGECCVGFKLNGDFCLCWGATLLTNSMGAWF